MTKKAETIVEEFKEQYKIDPTSDDYYTIIQKMGFKVVEAPLVNSCASIVFRSVNPENVLERYNSPKVFIINDYGVSHLVDSSEQIQIQVLLAAIEYHCEQNEKIDYYRFNDWVMKGGIAYQAAEELVRELKAKKNLGVKRKTKGTKRK